jgi:hemerythrin
MALIHWNDELNTGIPSIDSQHRRLIELVDILDREVQSRADANAVACVLTELMSYANTHFANEESLMIACGYPGLRKHRLEHDAFSQRLRVLLARYVAGTTGIDREILVALRNWFVDHVSVTDAAYVPALRAFCAA